MKRVSLLEAVGPLPLPANPAWPDGVWDREVFARHNVTVSVFAPRTTDHQSAHEEDEFYFIAAGSARFHRQGASEIQVMAGDALFVAVGHPHRFVAMSPDFAAWVVFISWPANVVRSSPRPPPD